MFSKNFSSSIFVFALPFLAPTVVAGRCRVVGEGGIAFAVIVINEVRCNSATDQNNHDGFCPLRNSDLEKLGKGVVLLMESSILMDARTD